MPRARMRCRPEQGVGSRPEQARVGSRPEQGVGSRPEQGVGSRPEQGVGNREQGAGNARARVEHKGGLKGGHKCGGARRSISLREGASRCENLNV